MRVIQIDPNDNVVVALRPIDAGVTLKVPGIGTLRALDAIPQGHKMAIRALASGDDVVKYGVSIGRVVRDVAAGSWLHTHNMATNLSGELIYSYHPTHPRLAPATPEAFKGFRRLDGRAAIRNEIWIIPTVGCVNEVARALAEDASDLVHGSVDGVRFFPHPFGCSQTGADLTQTGRILAALARHPHAAGVLFVSLGCESLTHERLLEELGDFDDATTRFLCCQDVPDELMSGRAILSELIDAAADRRRESIGVDELVIGMKCGGSDGLSGVTANPVIGRVSDMIIARGGSSVLTEVPEMFGAESFLLDRCIDQTVFDEASRMLNGFKNYYLRHNEVVYENPSPGNKDGGITTLEDKSCGCVQKGGTAPIVDVLDYAGAVTRPGLSLLCSPGNDMVSTTALTAAGCHLILFSTGRGTPFGAPAPTLKISSNSQLSASKPGWIDFNAGAVADGTRTIEGAAQDLWQLLLETASGEATSSERRGSREISIWKDGVVL